MISGLNQEVDILGRVFHFQTELSDQDGLSIRTEVFVGGKVVATRETRLEGRGNGSDDAIRARMKEQHNRTLATFVKRARQYQERELVGGRAAQPAGGSASLPQPMPDFGSPTASDTNPSIPRIDLAWLTPSSPAPLAPPGEALAAAAADALDVRRLVGRFRRDLEPLSAAPEDLVARLEAAAGAFERLVASPVFASIRVDEQVRCNLVREQLGDWLASRRDGDTAAETWSEIVTLVRYLTEVNRRAELVAFDQQLLLWALDRVQSEGASAEVVDRLQDLYGRHPQLDRILECPEGVSSGTWIAHLRSVLTLL